MSLRGALLFFPGAARQGRCATKQSPRMRRLLRLEVHPPRNDIIFCSNCKDPLKLNTVFIQQRQQRLARTTNGNAINSQPTLQIMEFSFFRGAMNIPS